jgi:hypothetical protein
MRATWGLTLYAFVLLVLSGCAHYAQGAAPAVAPMQPEEISADGAKMSAPEAESREYESLGEPSPGYLGPPPPPPPPGSDGRVAILPAPSAPGGGARPERPSPAKAGETTGITDTKEARPDVPPVAPGATTPPKPEGPQTLAGPLLIYNATVTMAVFEVSKALESTQKLARELGGYLVRRDDQMIVIRVPAAKYREALDSVGKLGDVLHRAEDVQDVTDQFFDLTVRVQNARALRQRLEQMLVQARNVEEALMVERELSRVTEEIERLEGRLKLMRELIAFSTITVEFRPRATEQLTPGVRLPFPWLDQLGLPSLLSL